MGDRFRKLAPKPWPDWFWLLSGGVDSVAAFLLTVEAIRENYGKRAVAIYLETRVGNPLQRIYVEQLVDAYDEQMWSLRTHEKFEDRVAKRGKFEDRDDAGPPGGAQHSNVQRELKGRQRDILERGYDHITYVTGIRAEESPARAEKPKGEVIGGVQYVKPVYELTKKECVEIILRSDAPINPLWVMPDVIGDCGCLSNGDPSELDATEEYFPAFAQRLREIEEAASADAEWKEMLGWDGLSADERAMKRDGYKQMSLCDESCGRRRDPDVVRAFKAKLDGEPLDVQLSNLYGGTGWAVA